MRIERKINDNFILGSKVFKSRSLFPSAFDHSVSSNNTNNKNENKQLK